MQEEQDIRTLTTKQAWEAFITEGGKETEAYEQVRFGIKIKFDIHYYIEDYLTIKPKKGVAVIRGKAYKLEDLWSEIEDRTIKMKEYLLSLEHSSLDADWGGQ